MKLKQNFPFIVLFILSCILLAALPTVDFLQSAYPSDPSLKLKLAIRQALTFGGLSLLCVWMGAGTHALVARIQDASKRKMFSLVTTLGSFFLCILLPILGLALTYGIFSIGDGWQQLPDITEAPAEVVAAGDNIVVIRSETGNYYSCRLSAIDDCWQKQDKPDDPIIQSSDYTRTTENTDTPRGLSSKKIISIKGVTYSSGPQTTHTHYAVLSDGTVWYIKQDQTTAGMATGLLGMLSLPFMVFGVLFLIGIGLMSLLRWVAGRIWKEEISN